MSEQKIEQLRWQIWGMGFFIVLLIWILGLLLFYNIKALTEEMVTIEDHQILVESVDTLVALSVQYAEETEAVTEEADVEDPNPYAAIELSSYEKELLAKMAYAEARGESFEGQVAVVQVALNRYLHSAFSYGSVAEVLLDSGQFSIGSTYTDEQIAAVEAALDGNDVLDLNTNVVYFSTGSLTLGSYYKTIGNHVFRTYN